MHILSKPDIISIIETFDLRISQVWNILHGGIEILLNM